MILDMSSLKNSPTIIILATTFIILLIFCSPPLFFFMYWKSEKNRIREERGAPFETGNLIVQALRDYRVDEGVFPSELAPLVESGFLEEIPSPGYGENSWSYIRPEQGHFELCVHGKYTPIYVCYIKYPTRQGFWHSDS